MIVNFVTNPCEATMNFFIVCLIQSKLDAVECSFATMSFEVHTSCLKSEKYAKEGS